MSQRPVSLEVLLRRAAVSGRFSPSMLLGGVPDDQRDALVGELSLYCDEDLDGTGRAWVLLPSVRRETLSRLTHPDDVRAALQGAPKPAEDDPFAQALRQVLSGRPLRPPRAGQGAAAKDDAARHAALQFCKATPVVDQGERQKAFDDTRGRIAALQREAAIATVLPTRLFGRQTELKRLLAFAAGESADPRPTLVTGIAGVGKSALVAAVMKRWTAKDSAAVLLDFDRADLTAGAPLPLARELMRQLEAHWLQQPGEPFRKAAEIAGEVRARIRSEEGSPTLESSSAQDAWLVTNLFGILHARLPTAVLGAPLLLIFDSFEVVAARGPEVVDQILRFEHALRTEAGLEGLRALISGREAPVQAEEIERKFGPASRHICVRGLTEAAGAAFLQRQDQRQRFPTLDDRRRVSRLLNGHPLAILVLERFARNRTDKDVRSLIDDLQTNTEFSAEFAQAFVYTRILDRIRDEDLEALAHPGLALREISADLIRLVLAGRAGLGEISRQRADQLLAKLARQYWLVEPAGAGRLRHRPDLRRLMLPAMFAGRSETDSAAVADRKTRLRIDAIRVCHAAAAFYAKGPKTSDPAYAAWEEIPQRTKRAEATYYRALAGVKAPSTMDRQKAADLRAVLGDDLATLPTTWRALIKAAAGEFATITPDERATLSGAFLETATSVAVEQQLRAGQSRAATQTIQRQAAAEPQTRLSMDRLDQLVRLAFDDGDFDRVGELGDKLLGRWSAGETTPSVLDQIDKGGFWATGVWKAALALAAGSAPSPLASRLTSGRPSQAWAQWLMSGLWSSALEPPFAFNRRSFVDGLRTAALLSSRGDSRPREQQVDIAALSLAHPRLVLQLADSRMRPSLEFSPLSDLADDRLANEGVMLDDLNRAYARKGTIEVERWLTSGLEPSQWRRAAIRGLTPELHEPFAKRL